MKRPPIKISWYAWCLYKLARREYSAHEMRQQMVKRAAEGNQEVEPDAIIDQLKAEGYLNDERYVENQIHYYTETFARKGPELLRRELEEKGGVSKELIDHYICPDDEKWNLLARKIGEKILQESGFSEPPFHIPHKHYAKLKQSLYRKGFRSEQIDFALEEITPVAEVAPELPSNAVQKLVEKRMAAGRGPYDIHQYLRQKGVPDALAQAQLDIPDEVWIELAVRERIKRFGEKPPGNKAERRKQSEFLQRRGFLFPQIRQALESDST